MPAGVEIDVERVACIGGNAIVEIVPVVVDLQRHIGLRGEKALPTAQQVAAPKRRHTGKDLLKGRHRRGDNRISLPGLPVVQTALQTQRGAFVRLAVYPKTTTGYLPVIICRYTAGIDESIALKDFSVDSIMGVRIDLPTVAHAGVGAFLAAAAQAHVCPLSIGRTASDDIDNPVDRVGAP
jgi:hypothetical protein